MHTDMIKDSLGARCMVLSKDNQLLFIGTLGHYDTINQKLRIDFSTQCPVRGLMKQGDLLKLQIKQNGKAHQFVLAEGPLEQVLNHYLVITPQSVMEKSEEREYFRQPVMQESIISFVNRKAAGNSCIVVDVSATGISIQSNAIYEIGDCLWLYNQPLFPGGLSHSLEFLVVRKHPVSGGKYRNFYGCKFINVTSEAQEKLFSDIFALQSTSLRSLRDK